MTMAPGAASEQIMSIAGPLLVGYLLNWGLYGAVAVQVYIYYLAFPKDRPIHKWLVYGVFTLETLQVILVAHDAFASFVTGFGQLQALTDVHFTWFSIPILGGVVAFTVQLFYAFRIYTLSKSRVIGGVISLLATLALIGALISGIEAVMVGNLTKLTSKVDHIGHGLFDITSGVCDIVIASCMAFYLSRMDTGAIKTTHNVISKIIRLVVGTGTLTAAIAIIDICLYYSGTPKHKAWFLAPAVILGRLYSNSMMVIFNSRVEMTTSRSITESSEAVRSFRPAGQGDAIVARAWDGNHNFPPAKWDSQIQGAGIYPPPHPSDNNFVA